MRGVIGVKGNLLENWSYEAAANFNRTNHRFRNRNLIDGAKYTELVNSVPTIPSRANRPRASSRACSARRCATT